MPTVEPGNATFHVVRSSRFPTTRGWLWNWERGAGIPSTHEPLALVGAPRDKTERDAIPFQSAQDTLDIGLPREVDEREDGGR